LNTRFEAVILDIDGTLLDDRLNLPESVKKAIMTLRSHGVTVVFCSGRMYLSMKRWVEKYFPYSFPLISYNGAQIHLSDQTVPFYSRALSNELTLTLLDTLRKEGVYRHYYWKEQIYASSPGTWAQSYAEHSGVDVQVVDDLEALAEKCKVEPVKVLAIDHPKKIDRLQERLAGKIEKVTMFKSFATYLDFVPDHTDKGVAITEIAQKLNFSTKNTVMLGDSENDSFGFKVVGYSVAMGNAQKNLQGLSSWVAPDNNHEGAYWALLHCFPDILSGNRER
jgi:Cof subfamily protein (haloacid dehalogenase superfamily)